GSALSFWHPVIGTERAFTRAARPHGRLNHNQQKPHGGETMLLLRQNGVMPFHRLSALGGEVDRLFESLTRLPHNGSQGGWAPPMEVRETQDAVLVALEVPGLSPDEVEVTVDQDRLTITGEKRTSSDQDSGRRWLSERRFGRFTRVLSLPK